MVLGDGEGMMQFTEKDRHLFNGSLRFLVMFVAYCAVTTCKLLKLASCFCWQFFIVASSVIW